MKAETFETQTTDPNNFQMAVQSTMRTAAEWLIDHQKPDGHWVGTAESNACLDAQWCLALWFLGLENHPLRGRLGQSLLDTQRPDGSWQVYYGAPNGDINATVEAYAALRSLGHRDEEPALSKARAWIAAKGGLRNVRVFTRYWLALIGEWPWEKTPNIPPEVIWFPLWFPFSIYNFAQWARATLMPIAILSARRPSRPLPPENRLERACSRRAARRSTTTCRSRPAPAPGTSSSAAPTRSCTPCRTSEISLILACGASAAIRHVLEWIIRHQDADGGLGRHSAAVDLRPDGAARRRLRARTIQSWPRGSTRLNDPDWRGGPRARRPSSRPPTVRSGTPCWCCSPSTTPACLGITRRSREVGAMGAGPPGPGPGRLVASSCPMSSPAAGRSNTPTISTPTPTTPPSP